MTYMIRGLWPDDHFWWSNEDGWVDKESADTFSDHERQTLRLPRGGEWTDDLG